MGERTIVRKTVREVFDHLYLTQAAEDQIVKVISFKLYDDEYHTGVPNNLLVFANDEVYLQKFMSAFDRMIEKYDPERKRFKLVLLETFSDEVRKEDPEFELVQESFMQAHASIVSNPDIYYVIGTTSTSDRDLFSSDERFRYQTMNHFINLDFVDAEDMYRRFMKFLEDACESGRYGFREMTEGFRTDMKVYFEAIYPDKSINKNLAFLLDMRNRIVILYGEKENRGNLLDVEHIPFYLKNEGVSTSEESLQSEETSKNDTSPMRLPAFPEVKDVVSSENLNENAVILLFPSDAKPFNKEEDPYTFTDRTGSRIYYGIQTSDAPTEFLIDQLVRDGRKLSAVLCITSHQVKHDLLDEQTAYDRFKNLVLSYYQFRTGIKLDEEVFCDIPYDYELSESGEDIKTEFRQETAYGMFSLIRKKLEEMDDCAVYIDYSGGLRDVNLLLATIIRFLEFSDNRCERIIYSNIADKENRKLVDISYIYNIFQLINGTGNFLTTGNARELSEAFNQTDEENEKEVLSAISDFSDVTMLNDLSLLDDKLSDVVNKIKQFEENSGNIKRINQGMLVSLLPVIRRKMHLSDMIRDSKISYPILINWCLENGMIQQALTVYVDKLPIYYFDTNKIQIGNSFGEIKSKTTIDAHLQMDEGRVRIQRGNLILQNGAGKSCAEVFYEDLFDKILYCMISSDTKTTEQLGEIRHEILNETDIVSLAVHFNIFRFWVKKKFEQLKEKYDKWQSENGDQSQREFNLLLADLDQLMDEDHKLSRILSLYSREEIQTIRQMNIQQNSFSSFLNHRAKQLSFDLFGITEERLQRIRGKENTLLKKMETIAGLLDLNEEKAERWFGSVENKNRLIYVMSYYLATKMLRNRSNHANEDDAKAADDELKEFFQSRQLPVLQGICSENKIIIDTSYHGIHDLLYSGIRFSQAEWQIPIDLGL